MGNAEREDELKQTLDKLNLILDTFTREEKEEIKEALNRKIEINAAANETTNIEGKCNAYPKRDSIKVGYFYPRGDTNSLGIFLHNLQNMKAKIIRQPFSWEENFIQEYSPTEITNFNLLPLYCAGKNAELVIFILAAEYYARGDFRKDLERSFAHKNLNCKIVNLADINRRFLYLDLIVEVMMLKKKVNLTND